VNFFSSSKKLGILGGGQLGKMLLYSSRKWDIYTAVMDPNEKAPARLACNEFSQGDLMDYEAVYNFGKKVDLLTIEIENVNVKALLDLKKEGLKVYPQPEILEIIQNKTLQKKFYIQNKIPTAGFREFKDLDSLKNSIAKGNLSFPFVWKAALMGYDGFGVSIVRNNKDLEKLNEGECIAEDFISFKSELSVIVARRPQGEILTYPVVEMEFNSFANQVEYVISPARISKSEEIKVKDLAFKIAKKYKHVGVLAIEFFLTETGDILVNEVAPRPHNSGHLTIEASTTNQFDQHLRAIMDLPLGDTSSKICSVMVNLVGDKNHRGPVFYKNIDQILAIKGVTPHLYGKNNTRPFRKMGHVTVVNNKIEKARKIAEDIKSIIQVISK
tara:strand:+ start:29939 stop:31093 length:1155 start_codon:yes stop_codon:yes gene_type:complete